MITKQQLINSLIGLTETNDLQALEVPGFVSRELCQAEDVVLVRRMAQIVEGLHNGFDYSGSPEFLKLVAGKSDEVQAMRLRLLTPPRKTELRKRFGDALARILESPEIYDLVKSSEHERLKELRSLLLEVSNKQGPPVV